MLGHHSLAHRGQVRGDLPAWAPYNPPSDRQRCHAATSVCDGVWHFAEAGLWHGLAIHLAVHVEICVHFKFQQWPAHDRPNVLRFHLVEHVAAPAQALAAGSSGYIRDEQDNQQEVPMECKSTKVHSGNPGGGCEAVGKWTFLFRENVRMFKFENDVPQIRAAKLPRSRQCAPKDSNAEYRYKRRPRHEPDRVASYSANASRDPRRLRMTMM